MCLKNAAFENVKKMTLMGIEILAEAFAGMMLSLNQSCKTGTGKCFRTIELFRGVTEEHELLPRRDLRNGTIPRYAFIKEAMPAGKIL